MTAMDTVNFLGRVVAPGNWIAIAFKPQDTEAQNDSEQGTEEQKDSAQGKKKNGLPHRFFRRDQLDEAAGFIRWAARHNMEVWHGCGSYKDAEPDGKTKQGKPKYRGRRKRDNVQGLRGFWYDPDIKREGDGKGPEKAFANEPEALQWLKTFCDATALPYPSIIIRSGYGLHVYWILEDALSRDEWQPYAEAVKHALIAHGAKGDLGLTADAARILRPPGTFNLKDPANPKPVGAIHTGPDVPNGVMYEKLRPYMGATTPRTGSNYSSNSHNVIPFAGTKPALANGRTSSLNAAAQPGVEQGWFNKLNTESKNELLRAIAEHSDFVALADAGRDEWLDYLFGFADAEYRGATEARAIALEWCQTSGKFKNEKDFDRDWDSFNPGRPNGITVATTIGAAGKIKFDLSPWRDLANGAAQSGAANTNVVGSLAGTTAGGKPLKIDPSGPRAITDIPAFLQPHDAVAIMNATFAFVHNWGGEALLVQFHPDGSLTAISEEQLKKSLANRRVEITSDDGTKKSYINLAKYWLTNSQRREVDLVAFSPEGKRITAHIHSINLWRGFAKQPQKGCWRQMRKHLYKVLCKCDKKKFKYLIKWMAHAVQRPETAPGSVPVLRSASEGAGKTMVIQWMADIFGEHAIMLNDAEQLIGTFTDHLENKSFVGVNEPGFPGDHKAAGKLKSMITDTEWMINGKYRAIHRVPNIAHFMFSTNRDWAIPAGNKARRWLMLDVDETHADDEAYFAPIRREAENGGIEAMLYDLLRVDLSSFNSWNVPKTAALREQQLLSASTITRWAVDTVSVGITIPAQGSGPVTVTWGWLDRRALYEAYCLWCKNMRERALSANKFTRWLNKLGFPTKTVNGYLQYDIATPRSFGAAALHEGGIV